MRIVKTTEALSEEDELCTKIGIDYGSIVNFAVVQVSEILGSVHQVVRYDCSHGYAHKDCLYERKPRKEELPDGPLDELFELARQDIRERWKDYRNQYTRNRTAKL